MAYSERKRKFTFAKNYLRGVLFFSAGGQQLLLGYENILVNLSVWINSAITQPCSRCTGNGVYRKVLELRFFNFVDG